MPITLNGTTGVVTPGATIGSINGILKSSSGVVSQAVAGTDYLAPGSAGTLILGTAQTASGTAVDFTGIPSWAKRITVIFADLSLNGNDNIIIQLGDSSGIQSSGYLSVCGYITSGSNITASTNGFMLSMSVGATAIYHGCVVLNLLADNKWIANGSSCRTDSIVINFTQGLKSLSNSLSQIKIKPTGTNQFDAGTINISYE